MLHDLYTPQGEALTGTPWQIYPRPQLKRGSYVNLNGDWEFAVSQSPQLPEEYPDTIRLPFCPESLLSGVHQHFGEDTLLFYRRSFTLPEDFNRGRVLLHFGAVDYIADVWLDGQYLGGHEGGYTPFTFDVTELTEAGGEYTLTVRAEDRLDFDQPRGKQSFRPEPFACWYTPVTGIWQSVWLESVPAEYIRKLNIENRDYGVAISMSRHWRVRCMCRRLAAFR